MRWLDGITDSMDMSLSLSCSGQCGMAQRLWQPKLLVGKEAGGLTIHRTPSTCFL